MQIKFFILIIIIAIHNISIAQNYIIVPASENYDQLVTELKSERISPKTKTNLLIKLSKSVMIDNTKLAAKYALKAKKFDITIFIIFIKITFYSTY